MEIITTLLAFLLALGVLIIVHELGHYAMARRCGVKVLRFSVGFGRPLLRRTWGPDQTEWVVSAIPYGGYVKMLDEADEDAGPIAPQDLPRAFNRQSLGKRAAIVAAGPVANLLFAIFLYWLINLIGTAEAPPYLGPPVQGSPAALAGLHDGDLVLNFAGQPVRSWGELRWALLQGGVAGTRASLEVRGIDGSEHAVVLDLSSGHTQEVDEAWFDTLGLARGAGAPVIRALVPQGVAEQAGLKVGDRLLSIDGEAVQTATEATRRVRASAGREQLWRVEAAAQGPSAGSTPADGEDNSAPPLLRGPVRELRITPVAVHLPDGQDIGRVGIDFLELRTVRYGPVAALQRAAWRTWDTSLFSLQMIGRMLDGRASWHNLSGPVSIADVAGQTARIGLVAYLSFLALVSISLGVLNLLPIPILDGGHLLYYAVEVVKGSPPSVRTVAVAQRLGVGMLLLLTALALYNDLTRLLS